MVPRLTTFSNGFRASLEPRSKQSWITHPPVSPSRRRDEDPLSADGYQALITTDQNLKYQQNLSDRVIRILVLMTTSWPRIKKEVDRVTEALDELEESGYAEVDF
jgi:hypothetical protein